MSFKKLVKTLCFGLVATVALVLTACSGGKFGKSLTHAEYMSAKDGETVVIEGYIQARRTWWNGAVLYLQDDNGGYFIYNLPCTEDQYKNDLKVGNKIQVKGYKTSWQGEVEIQGDQAGKEAEWCKLSGTKEYPAYKLGNLVFAKEHQNEFVEYENLVVANVYEEGRNVYYDVTDGDDVFTFCVETYMEQTPKTSTVYTTVAGLAKGDVINVKGFQYIYGTPQLHTTEITKQNKNVFGKRTGVLTYEQYLAAEAGAKVKISGYIMDKQDSIAYGNTTLYIADKDGAYFVYRLPVTQEQYNKLVPGTHVEVEGYKSVWEGEIEVDASVAGNEGTFEILNDYRYLPSAFDATSLLTNEEELLKHRDQKVAFKGLEVLNVQKPKAEGGDIYFDVKYTPETGNAVTLTFCVESSLRAASTEVYKTVSALKNGDKVNLVGYLYIYDKPQLHTIECVVLANK